MTVHRRKRAAERERGEASGAKTRIWARRLPGLLTSLATATAAEANGGGQRPTQHGRGVVPADLLARSTSAKPRNLKPGNTFSRDVGGKLRKE